MTNKQSDTDGQLGNGGGEQPYTSRMQTVQPEVLENQASQWGQRSLWAQ